MPYFMTKKLKMLEIGVQKPQTYFKNCDEFGRNLTMKFKYCEAFYRKTS